MSNAKSRAWIDAPRNEWKYCVISGTSSFSKMGTGQLTSLLHCLGDRIIFVKFPSQGGNPFWTWKTHHRLSYMLRLVHTKYVTLSSVKVWMCCEQSHGKGLYRFLPAYLWLATSRLASRDMSRTRTRTARLHPSSGWRCARGLGAVHPGMSEDCTLLIFHPWSRLKLP